MRPVFIPFADLRTEIKLEYILRLINYVVRVYVYKCV